jgi:hypothetical protein
MTQDDIIRMAREAKLPYEYDTGRVLHLKELEHFAALIEERTHTNNKAKWYQEGVEAEREACAELCATRNMSDFSREDQEAQRCAYAIRARGQA